MTVSEVRTKSNIP